LACRAGVSDVNARRPSRQPRRPLLFFFRPPLGCVVSPASASIIRYAGAKRQTSAARAYSAADRNRVRAVGLTVAWAAPTPARPTVSDLAACPWGAPHRSLALFPFLCCELLCFAQNTRGVPLAWPSLLSAPLAVSAPNPRRGGAITLAIETMSSQQSVPPSGPRMCSGKNCNFYGDPVTGLCSKCYREEQAARKAANGGNGAAPASTASAAPAPAPAPAPASAPLPVATVSAPIAIPGRTSRLLEESVPSSVPNQGGTCSARAR